MFNKLIKNEKGATAMEYPKPAAVILYQANRHSVTSDLTADAARASELMWE